MQRENHLSCNGQRLSRSFFFRREVASIENHTNLQAAARADSNLIAISQVFNEYLEAIATWAWIVVDLEGRIEGHIFYLDLIVYLAFIGHGER